MLYRVLAVGDVVGEEGLRHLSRHLRQVKKMKNIDENLLLSDIAAEGYDVKSIYELENITKKDEVLVYKVVGGRRSSRVTKVMDKFYVIVSTDYHVYPSLQLNPKHGGIARTIPAPDSRFEEQLYFYRPDLKPEPPREDDEE